MPKRSKGDMMSRPYEVISRFSYIVKLLEESRRGLTAAEIHQRVQEYHPVDKRTVYRDIEKICDLFPIEYEADPEDSRKKRYRIDGNKKIEKYLVLSPRELMALYLARNSLLPLKETPFYADLQRAFQQIEGLLGPKGAEFLDELSEGVRFEPSPRWGLGVQSDVLDTIRACCQEGHLLSVSYRSLNSGDCRKRKLGPHFIYFARGGIYLVAEDIEVEQVKVFNITRMSDPLMLSDLYEGKAVDPNEFFDASFGVFQGQPAEEVQILCDSVVAEYIRERRWHHSQQVVPQSNGFVRVSFHVTVSYELVQWVLALGEHATVLQPESLKEQVVASAKGILDLYKKRVA